MPLLLGTITLCPVLVSPVEPKHQHPSGSPLLCLGKNRPASLCPSGAPSHSTQPLQLLWEQRVKGLSTGTWPDMAPLPGPCRKSLHCPYYGVPPFAHMRRDTYPSRRAHQDRLKKSNTTRATLERGGTACLLADFCIQLPLSAIVEITTAEIFHDWGPW